MNTRSASLAALVMALSSACGSVVVATEGDAAAPARPADASDAATVDAAASPTCAEVRATCGAAPQQFVRGHAEGLAGVDGARARFAVRYLRDDGNGLSVPHGVVSAWGRVEGGAFEACVCLPRGGNEYPQIAAVVFAPGSTGETSRDVARAWFSQRYATLGDEDVASALGEVPADVQVEAALAAMVDRASTVTVQGLDATVEGARVYGGLVADERPIAAQIASGAVTAGRARFDWIMPGRQWPSERLVLLVDRNGDRVCNDGDLGASVRLDGRQEITAGTWLQGAALTTVCQALRLDAAREQ